MRKKINVGIVGLGRLGKQYARNLQFKIPEANLVAACSIVKDELKYAQEELGVDHVYEKYEDMLDHPGLEAVFVVSSTHMHVKHLKGAVDADKHVFCEKPLSISVDECLGVEKYLRDKGHLKVVVGFVRRFDPSYRYAKRKVDAGAIGRPFLVKSQTVDMDDNADFQIKFVKHSGGIFHDYNIHDIDLARWFMGAELKSVHAVGGSFKYPAFAEVGDADNVLTSCVFEDNRMAVIYGSRTAKHGHDTFTEVVGTEGSLRIGRPSYMNRVEIYDQHGARKECLTNFWDRFKEAFLLMTEDFIKCIIHDVKPQTSIHDATMATTAATAFTKSFKEGGIVYL